MSSGELLWMIILKMILYDINVIYMNLAKFIPESIMCILAQEITVILAKIS